MKTKTDRKTVDLSDYPDLVVIYLGMRIRAFAGLKKLLGLGPQIQTAGEERPAVHPAVDPVGEERPVQAA